MPRVKFGADGIRGTAGEWPWIPSIVVRIGQALGQSACRRSGRPLVAIGRDTRPSGESLSHCLVAGLTGQGANVIDLGVITTPGVAFLTQNLCADLGVMVSASHNPLEYNGIKLVGPNGLRLRDKEESEIENLINKFVSSTGAEYATKLGQQTYNRHLAGLYIQDHVKQCLARSPEGLKVVLDCANGAASRIAPEVFSQLGAEVVAVNASGGDINYYCGSEHVREHPQDLVKVMQRHRVGYGFAFDGDGDRLVIVNSKGKVFDGNDLLFILAKELLKEGDTVVTIHSANRGLEEALSLSGIRTVYTDNGDKNIEREMWGSGYLLGGEPGGNIIINDGHHTAADAIYTALVIGGMLARDQHANLEKMVAPLQKRPQVTVSSRVPSPFTPKQRAILNNQIRRLERDLGEDSRIMLHDSGTEPGVVRVMVEGGCAGVLEKVSKTADAICQIVQQVASSKD